MKIQNPDPRLQANLSDALDVHPIIAQLLINREITDVKEAKDFLCADLSGLHNPFLFKNMKKTVLRIKQAQANKESVFIVGDYDVDGVTSSALMNNVLTQMNIELVHYIPSRMEDGYGLNEDMGRLAKEECAVLMI